MFRGGPSDRGAVRQVTGDKHGINRIELGVRLGRSGYDYSRHGKAIEEFMDNPPRPDIWNRLRMDIKRGSGEYIPLFTLE